MSNLTRSQPPHIQYISLCSIWKQVTKNQQEQLQKATTGLNKSFFKFAYIIQRNPQDFMDMIIFLCINLEFSESACFLPFINYLRQQQGKRNQNKSERDLGS